MIKLEAIKDFTLERYDDLKDIERKSVDTKGRLYTGDKFVCDKELADYLTGKNEKEIVVAKVIEVIPEQKATLVETDKVEVKSIDKKPKKSYNRSAKKK